MPQLLTGLALGGFIGIPGVATSLLRWPPWVPGGVVSLQWPAPCWVPFWVPDLHRPVQGGHHGDGRACRVPALQGHQRIVVFIPLVLLGPIVAGIIDGVPRQRGLPARAGPGCCPGRRWVRRGRWAEISTAGNCGRGRAEIPDFRSNPGRAAPVLEGPAAAGAGDAPLLRRVSEEGRETWAVWTCFRQLPQVQLPPGL